LKTNVKLIDFGNKLYFLFKIEELKPVKF